MLDSELLEYIFSRLTKNGNAIFSQDEIENWPSHMFEIFKRNHLIQLAEPAKSIECDGCEQNCIMPVHTITYRNNNSVHTFISCDKTYDIGRVPVDKNRLVKWQITDEMIANKLSQMLGLSTIPEKNFRENTWTLGIFRTKKHTTSITLIHEGSLLLSLAGHKISLLELLKFQDNELILDKDEITFLIDNPHDNNETSEERRKRLKNLVNMEQAKVNKGFLKAVAAEERISVPRLKQIVYKKI